MEDSLSDVALTRAKDELYLTYPMLNPKSYTADILCRPSRFLDDFPKEMVEEWNVGNEWSSDSVTTVKNRLCSGFPGIIKLPEPISDASASVSVIEGIPGRRVDAWQWTQLRSKTGFTCG